MDDCCASQMACYFGERGEEVTAMEPQEPETPDSLLQGNDCEPTKQLAKSKNQWALENQSKLTSPGRDEFVTLLGIASLGGCFGWAGIGFAGAALGTVMFPCIGTIFGGAMATICGFALTCLVVSLFMVLRGRLPLPFAMAWAGAMSGSMSLGFFSVGSSDWVYAWAAPLMGAMGARWLTGIAGKFRLDAGSALRSWRSWRQFSIFDLLLLTTWLAIVCALGRSLLPVYEGEAGLVAFWFALSLATALGVEGLAWLLARLKD